MLDKKFYGKLYEATYIIGAQSKNFAKELESFS